MAQSLMNGDIEKEVWFGWSQREVGGQMAVEKIYIYLNTE